MKQTKEEYKALEQAWMSLKDDYAELARALGVKGDAWFGDPLKSHKEVIAVAKSLEQSTIMRCIEAIEDKRQFANGNYQKHYTDMIESLKALLQDKK